MKAVSTLQILFFLFCYTLCIGLQTKTYSQSIQRHTVSAQGGVYMVNGFVFSQSVGQLSVIGTATTPRFTFQQGFQQSLAAMNSNAISVPDFAVTIFPNPVVDSFTITVANTPEEPLTIKITNLLGQVLYQGQMSSFQSQKTIPFGSFSNGTYLVQLFSGNQIVTKKIIKI